MKALGSGWGKKVGWKDIEVLADNGRPVARLRGGALKLLGDRKVFLSISRTREVAVAVAVIE